MKEANRKARRFKQSIRPRPKMRTRRAADEDRREELLRPSRHLGYDRDALASFLMSREAYRQAEWLYRRAIWANPFEARFRAHLALCLLKQGRLEEAREISAQLDDIADDEIREIVSRVNSRADIQRPGSEDRDS